MEVYLDSTNYKRIDLCMDYRVNSGEIKNRRFVIRYGNKVCAIEDFIEAVTFYRSIEAFEEAQGYTLEDLSEEQK